METKTYVVTDEGGPRPDVGGKRRFAGDRIELTAKAAEFEISRGTVILASEHDAAQAKKAAKPQEAPQGVEKADRAPDATEERSTKRRG